MAKDTSSEVHESQRRLTGAMTVSESVISYALDACLESLDPGT
jgi:hypothetical protein